MTFEYEKLVQLDSQIRIAVLQPGCFQDEIVIQFVLRDLKDTTPTYQALSYVWGSEWSPALARLSSAHQSGRISITENLDSALRHLRSEKKPQSLWVDALCINQSDDEEKDVQVMNMGSIFKSARSVIAWLGEEENNSNTAITSMKDIGNNVNADWTTCILTWHGRGGTQKITRQKELERRRKVDFVEGNGTFPWTVGEIAAIYALLTRPYFQRAWIVQEIRLATRVLFCCGHATLPEQHVWKVIRCLSKGITPLQPRIDPEEWFMVIQRLWFLATLRAMASHVSIYTLRRNFGHLQCSDPRDKIYSVLGMLDAWSQDLKIVPTYLDTPEAVYTNITRRTCIKSSSLELLVHCEAAPGTLSLPSWVPDWSTPLRPAGLWTRWSASAFVAARPIFDESGLRCTASGVSVGCVADVGNLHVDLYNFDDLFAFLLASKPVEDMQSTYITGEDLLKSYCRTIASDHCQHSGRPPQKDMPVFEQGLDSLRLLWSGEFDENEAMDRSKLYFQTVNTVLRGRRLFKTQNGYIGLAPAETQNGDILCVLLGSIFPVIVRPKSNHTYMVVGPCYAHGLMQGEVIYQNRDAAKRGIRIVERAGLPDLYDSVNDVYHVRADEMLEAAGLRVDSIRKDPTMFFVAQETLRAVGIDVEDFVLV